MVHKAFDLGNLKGTYKLPELRYVPLSDLNSTNESRLLFEIFFAIGLTLLGVCVSQNNVSISFVITAIIFTSVGIFFLCRYLLKAKRLKSD